MKEKKLGRVFKVGDKVKLTKAGEECGFFATEFREGDTAEVMELNKFDGSIYRVMVTSGEAKGYRQTSGISASAKTWFEHVGDEKKRKKQRKYFRAGDFVTLKDGVDISEVTKFSDIKQGAIGIVVGYTEDGMMGIEYFYGKGFNFDHVKPEALRLATKKERKALHKHKIAKITYDDLVTEEIEQDTETVEVKIPPEYDVKVGDIVEVTLDVNGHPVGTIGEVVFVQGDTGGYYNRVKVRGNDRVLWNEIDVKLVYRKPETNSK